MIKMIQSEKEKMNKGLNATAKSMIFPSSVTLGREAIKIIQDKCNLEVAAMISADTSQEDRKRIKADFDKCQSGVIASYSITAKGFDIADTTGVQIGYGRMAEEGLTVHMVGRGSRRARGERGLPLEECVKKTRGTFYVATLVKDDGSIDPHAKWSKRIYDTLVSRGIYTIKQSLVSKSDGESKERKTKSPFLIGNEVDVDAPNELVDLFFEEDYTPDYIKDFGQSRAKQELQEKSIEDIVDLLLERD
jgi:superfamily II DNA/RNA helicase